MPLGSRAIVPSGAGASAICPTARAYGRLELAARKVRDEVPVLDTLLAPVRLVGAVELAEAALRGRAGSARSRTPSSTS